MRILEIGDYVFDADKLECIAKIYKITGVYEEYVFTFQVNGVRYNVTTIQEPKENILKIRELFIEAMKTTA